MAGVVTAVVAGAAHAEVTAGRVAIEARPAAFLPLVWGLVPPGVIQTPFHFFGAA